VRIRIDRATIANLTVGELELLEEKTGRPLSRLFDADAPRGTLLHSLAYITLRRDDPSATWELAADAVVELDDQAEVAQEQTGPTPVGRRRRSG
jgi:hypothetical protein